VRSSHPIRPLCLDDGRRSIASERVPCEGGTCAPSR
jgi:hypothetical protein